MAFVHRLIILVSIYILLTVGRYSPLVTWRVVAKRHRSDSDRHPSELSQYAAAILYPGHTHTALINNKYSRSNNTDNHKNGKWYYVSTLLSELSDIDPLIRDAGNGK